MARKQRGQQCVLRKLADVPEQSGLGGRLILQLSSNNARCIAGIETGSKWIQIRFFNGRKLDLRINPNSGVKAREGAVIFASMSSSQELHVRQAGVLSTEGEK